MAKSAHQCANELIQEGLSREKEAIHDPKKAVIHMDWYESVLNDPHYTGFLPLYARLALETNLFHINHKTDIIDTDHVQLYIDNMKIMIGNNNCEASQAVISQLDFHRLDDVSFFNL